MYKSCNYFSCFLLEISLLFQFKKEDLFVSIMNRPCKQFFLLLYGIYSMFPRNWTSLSLPWVGNTFKVKVKIFHYHTCMVLLFMSSPHEFTYPFGIKSSVRLRLKYLARCDRLETCFDIFKHRSCCLLPTLHPEDHVVLPCTSGMSNSLSHTLEVYRNVLHVLNCISKCPFRMVVH